MRLNGSLRFVFLCHVKFLFALILCYLFLKIIGHFTFDLLQHTFIRIDNLVLWKVIHLVRSLHMAVGHLRGSLLKIQLSWRTLISLFLFLTWADVRDSVLIIISNFRKVFVMMIDGRCFHLLNLILLNNGLPVILILLNHPTVVNLTAGNCLAHLLHHRRLVHLPFLSTCNFFLWLPCRQSAYFAHPVLVFVVRLFPVCPRSCSFPSFITFLLLSSFFSLLGG